MLESSVEILDLQDGCRDQNCDQKVGDGEGDDVPDCVGKQRCDTLGREGCITTCERTLDMSPSEGKR